MADQGRMVKGRFFKRTFDQANVWSSGLFVEGRLVKQPSNEEINVRHWKTLNFPLAKYLDPPNVFINRRRYDIVIRISILLCNVVPYVFLFLRPNAYFLTASVSRWHDNAGRLSRPSTRTFGRLETQCS